MFIKSFFPPRLLAMLLLAAAPGLKAQERWTAEQCMRYAALHSHGARQQAIGLDERKTERLQALGAFLPQVGASVGGQYNFGRAIDPETNTYTDVSTFNNGYSLSASVSLFDGLQRIHRLRAAQAAVALGRDALQAARDEAAQQALLRFADVAYRRGTLTLALAKRAESQRLMRKTELMLEVGTRSEADLAQTRATLAADDYEATLQQGLLNQALLALKACMNFPLDEPLEPDSLLAVAEGLSSTSSPYPRVRQAEREAEVARHKLRAARGGLFPSLALGAGWSTTYYQTLHRPNATPYATQLRNNAGRYVYASLSVPLFGRFQAITNLRRQRLALSRAEERLDEERTQLQRLLAETQAEVESTRSEVQKMCRRVEADSLSTHLVTRRYEEGLASPLDVQTAAVALLQSQALLLHGRLTLDCKTRLLNYYKGNPLWTE